MGFEIRAKSTKLQRAQRILTVTWDIADEKFRVPEQWVNFRNGRYTRVDFRSQRFDPFHATSSAFVGCDFRKVRFKSGSFGVMTRGSKQSIYRDCEFDGADLRRIVPENARFERCSFRGANLDGWRADYAEFVDCTFEGEVFDCRFSGRPYKDESGMTGRIKNEFAGNDFRGARLTSVMFVYGIDLDLQRLPVDPRYIYVNRPADRIRHARSIVATWQDDNEREAALFLLRLFSEGGYTEQECIFTDRNKKSIPRDVTDRVWELVTSAPIA